MSGGQANVAVNDLHRCARRAPAHIGQGSPLANTVQAASWRRSNRVEALRIRFNSAWPVQS